MGLHVKLPCERQGVFLGGVSCRRRGFLEGLVLFASTDGSVDFGLSNHSFYCGWMVASVSEMRFSCSE